MSVSTPTTLFINNKRHQSGSETGSLVSDLGTISLPPDESTGSGRGRSARAAAEVVQDPFAFRYKLRSIKLKGRADEIRLLQEAFDRLLEIERKRSELVLLSGPAGSGKSSLVEKALRNFVAAREGWFVSGKFDQHSNCVPFSALAEALTDLTELLLQADDKKSSLKRRVARAMGTNQKDVQVLKHLMPNIDAFLDEEDSSTQCTQVSDLPEHHPKQRHPTRDITCASSAPTLLQLKTALRSFLRVAASQEQPICVFIDDLQFANSESLGLLKAILSDDKSQHLLFVCSYRNDEFDIGSSGLEEETSFQTQSITSESLSISNIDQIVQELIRTNDSDRTRPIAELVFRKTSGNAFDVLEFLEQLYMKKLLHLADNGKDWQWDLDDIQEATDVTDNVAHTLIRDKVGRLPETSRMVLEVAAACIGHKFLVYFLEELMATTGMTSTDYHSALKAAVDDGIIESCEAHDSVGEECQTNDRRRWMKFTHDKVQRAVADMASENANLCRSLHLRVGRFSLTFRKTVPLQKCKEMFLFLSLENYSKCRELIDNDEEKLEFVRLSLEAGKLSSSRCALAQAASFVRKAAGVVSEGVMWSPENRNLALEFYCTLAELEMQARQHERCREAVRTIYSHTTNSIDDRLKAFPIEVENLCSKGELNEAIRTARGHIRTLGERFPSKITALHVVSELLRTKFRLSRLSDEHILSRPLMTDARTKTVMVLICKIIVSAQWLTTEDNTLVTCGLRLIRLTLEHGITPESMSGFVIYAIVEAAMGNYKVARRFEKLVNESFWQRSDTRGLIKSSARAGLAFMTAHMWKTLEECARDMESYTVVGMNGIDLNESSNAVFGGWSVRLFSKPWTLQSLSDDMDAFETEGRSLGIVRRELIITTPLRQYCLNLKGEGTSEPARLEGTAMDVMRSLEPDSSMLDSMDVWVVICQIYLSYQFEDWDYLKEHLVHVEKTCMAKVIGTKARLYHSLMIMAMSGLQLYEQTKSRRFLALGKRCRKSLKRLKKHGSPNATTPLMLVNAEYTRIQSSSQLSNRQIEGEYQAALLEAKKSSWFAEFICYERLLSHCCACGNEPKARYNLDLLLDDVCDPWGASGLADHVSRKYAFLNDEDFE